MSILFDCFSNSDENCSFRQNQFYKLKKMMQSLHFLTFFLFHHMSNTHTAFMVIQNLWMMTTCGDIASIIIMYVYIVNRPFEFRLCVELLILTFARKKQSYCFFFFFASLIWFSEKKEIVTYATEYLFFFSFAFVWIESEHLLIIVIISSITMKWWILQHIFLFEFFFSFHIFQI